MRNVNSVIESSIIFMIICKTDRVSCWFIIINKVNQQQQTTTNRLRKSCPSSFAGGCKQPPRRSGLSCYRNRPPCGIWRWGHTAAPRMDRTGTPASSTRPKNRGGSSVGEVSFQSYFTKIMCDFHRWFKKIIWNHLKDFSMRTIYQLFCMFILNKRVWLK